MLKASLWRITLTASRIGIRDGVGNWGDASDVLKTCNHTTRVITIAPLDLNQCHSVQSSVLKIETCINIMNVIYITFIHIFHKG